MTGQFAAHPVAPGEAEILGRALVGRVPQPDEAERYRQAVAIRGLHITGAVDRRLWGLALRGPGWMSCIDAGLAWLDPWSVLRHRIYLMLAVLEASPRHVDRFLPGAQYPRLHIIGTGLLAVLRVACGLVVVSLARTGRRG